MCAKGSICTRVSSKCETLKESPVASLLLMLHARPPLVLICCLPFPFPLAHLVFSHLLSPFSLRAQMLDVTCIRGYAEALQENGQKRASLGEKDDKKKEEKGTQLENVKEHKFRR